MVFFIDINVSAKYVIFVFDIVKKYGDIFSVMNHVADANRVCCGNIIIFKYFFDKVSVFLKKWYSIFF